MTPSSECTTHVDIVISTLLIMVSPRSLSIVGGSPAILNGASTIPLRIIIGFIALGVGIMVAVMPTMAMAAPPLIARLAARLTARLTAIAIAVPSALALALALLALEAFL